MKRAVFVSLVALLASAANANAESGRIIIVSPDKNISVADFASACEASGGAYSEISGERNAMCTGAESGDYDCTFNDDGNISTCEHTPGRRRGKLAEVLGITATGTGGTTVTTGGNGGHGNGNDGRGNGANASASGGNDASPGSANTGSGVSID